MTHKRKQMFASQTVARGQSAGVRTFSNYRQSIFRYRQMLRVPVPIFNYVWKLILSVYTIFSHNSDRKSILCRT